jgi:hypothetical protein
LELAARSGTHRRSSLKRRLVWQERSRGGEAPQYRMMIVFAGQLGPVSSDARASPLGRDCTDALDQSTALTCIPVGVELDLVLGARPLRADEKRETTGGRESEGDGLDVIELHACRPLDAPPQVRCHSRRVVR